MRVACQLAVVLSCAFLLGCGRQAETISWIRASGGQVWEEGVHVSLDGAKVEDVSQLANLKNIQWLNLNYTQVRDITPLAKLNDLQWL